MTAPRADGACEACLARAWLLARLAGHLDRERARIDALLALPASELIEAVGGQVRQELRAEFSQFRPGELRRELAALGLSSLCACEEDAYVPRLRELAAPPAALFVSGGRQRFLELAAADPVAVVGARRASGYGLEVARSLSRGLSSAGVTVISGMAAGIDSAAHAGALGPAGGVEGLGPGGGGAPTTGAPTGRPPSAGGTIAILPAGADRPYPASARALYRQIVSLGVVVSELPPRTSPRRWMFAARNRLIAGLSAATVVVEAGERSGSLVPAAVARQMGRPVGAVPGQVTSPLAAGPNNLIAAGALLIQSPQDVLDLLFGAGNRTLPSERRAPLRRRERDLLASLAAGTGTERALAQAGFEVEEGLAVLAGLELDGYLRRGPGGAVTVIP